MPKCERNDYIYGEQVDEALCKLYAALQEIAHSPSCAQRLISKLGRLAIRMPVHRVKRNHSLIDVEIYGRSMSVRADHPLPAILAGCPEFGMPLVLLIRALGKESLTMIDVGANIGDTVALVERYFPGAGHFLCVDGNRDFAALCQNNHQNNRRVTVIHAVISDQAGTRARLIRQHAGTASIAPLSSQVGYDVPIKTLDEIGLPFLKNHSSLDIIKIDTDGYDYSVLRSASELLRRHRPHLLFELHPYLWITCNESPVNVFEFLRNHEYSTFLLFSNRGQFHTILDKPSEAQISRLVELSCERRHLDDFHFDVIAGRPDILNETMELASMRAEPQQEC